MVIEFGDRIIATIGIGEVGDDPIRVRSRIAGK
jgi:hypothetical protein